MKEVEESPPVAVKFLFAGNQWSCDCETVSEIHDFLVLHNKYLHDAELMACQNVSLSKPASVLSKST